MAISFPNVEFPGTHASPSCEPIAIHKKRFGFPGVHGEAEMILGRSGRDINVGLIVHSASFTSRSAVRAALLRFDQAVGTHGELTIGDRDFPSCTFRGFRPTTAILEDVANTLNDDDGGPFYFVRGTLTFHQTRAAV